VPGGFGGVLQRLSLVIDVALGGIAALVMLPRAALLRRRLADLTDRAEKAYPSRPPW
jgi:hypothetical protein